MLRLMLLVRGGCVFSLVRLFETLGAVAHQAPLSMEFPRQEYRRGCHFLLQRIFLTEGLNLCFCIAGGFFITNKFMNHYYSFQKEL